MAFVVVAGEKNKVLFGPRAQLPSKKSVENTSANRKNREVSGGGDGARE